VGTIVSRKIGFGDDQDIGFVGISEHMYEMATRVVEVSTIAFSWLIYFSSMHFLSSIHFPVSQTLTELL
jgi:hypothetical protein